MGCASFAHHKLSDGMLAACPEAVQQFLDSLSADLQPLVPIPFLCLDGQVLGSKEAAAGQVLEASMPSGSGWKAC